MNFFTYRITLDMHSPTTQAVMNVKRNDSKRKFYFDLTDGGKPYTITEQCTAVFRGRKPDGNVLYNYCVIEDNEIIYELTNQTVSAVGLVDCEVTLYDAGGNQITSPRFVIRVNDILDSDSEVESQNEFTELATALGQVTALNMSMDGKTITFTNKDGESSTLSFSDKADGVVTVTFTDTDGNVSTFSINDGEKGADGAQGVPGRDGADGQDGSDGADGVSITNVIVNEQHHLIVTLSNGNTIDAGEIEGGGASTADQVSITDEEGYYSSDNVEGALAEIGENLYEIGTDVESLNRTVALKQDKIDDIVDIRNNALSGKTAYVKATNIEAMISSSATSSNKLVSASEMGDAIASVEAKQLYKTASQGSFATKAELLSATTFYGADGSVATPTKNDVAYILADESHDGKLAKYVVASVNPTVWGFVISISETSFTQAQNDAINSGITSAKRSGYDTHVANSDIHVTTTDKSTWNGKYAKPSTGIPKNDLASAVQNSLGKADTAYQKPSTGIPASDLASGIIPTIPDYVKAEAEATIAKSFLHGNVGRTIRFVAISDAHDTLITARHPTSANKQNIIQGNTDAGLAIKYIAERIGLDFVANLGDSCLVGETDETYTLPEIRDEIMNFNKKISDGFNGIPNIRLVGNHDETYSAASSARLWNSGAYNLYGRFTEGVKDGKNGYGYYDLEGQKVRVIYLNTSDSDNATSSGTLIAFSQEQKNWLCETLIGVNSKPNANEWKILILSHVPIDFGSANIATDIIIPYTNGGTYGSYTFTNHGAEIIGNCHGHMHCFNVGYIENKVRRWCTPNACYMFNNHYGSRSDYAPWVDSTTYNKTANSGTDTSFSLVTLDLDNNMAYVDNYGAGIDRSFSTSNVAPPSYTDLVPTAIDSTGTVFNSTGYKTGCYYNSSSGQAFATADNLAFTTIGLIAYNSATVHNIYVKGLSFSGTTYNRIASWDVNKNRLDSLTALTDGKTGAAVVSSVTKLADGYYKLTTISSSTGKPKYFAISGATIAGQTPIVTIDEPIT